MRTQLNRRRISLGNTIEIIIVVIRKLLEVPNSIVPSRGAHIKANKSLKRINFGFNSRNRHGHDVSIVY